MIYWFHRNKHPVSQMRINSPAYQATPIIACICSLNGLRIVSLTSAVLLLSYEINHTRNQFWFSSNLHT